MENDWVLIYTTDKTWQAEIAIALLEENEIDSFKVDKQDSSYNIGEICLFVSQEDTDEALLILTSHDLK
jgi:type III secretory pathway lipoprotein EscJ